MKNFLLKLFFSFFLAACCMNVKEQITFQRVFGGPGGDGGNFVQQTTDGGYIISGMKNYNSTNFTGLLYLIKTDSSGNSSWTKTYGGPLDSRGYSVQQTTDGGYVIGGYNLSGMGGTYDMYIV